MGNDFVVRIKPRKKNSTIPFLFHHSDQHVGMNFKSLITENEEQKVKNFFTLTYFNYFT